MRLDCSLISIGDGVEPSPIEKMLAADAIAHVRITRRGQDRTIDTGRSCWVASVAPAEILGVARAARREWQAGAAVVLSSAKLTLQEGREYLMFLAYEAELREFRVVHYYEVVDGRVHASEQDGEHGFLAGSRIGLALERLADTYRRLTGALRYDALSSKHF